VRPRIDIGAITLDLDRTSCDADDYLDAGERANLAITVMNGGATEMLDTVVSVDAATPGVFFPRGVSARIRRLGPFESVRIVITVALDRNFRSAGMLELNVNVANSQACEPLVSRAFTQRINVDDVPNVSRIDTVETLITPWTTTGMDASEVWTRVEPTPFNRAWLGADSGTISDTMLESPDLNVGMTGPFVISFEHRHSFETDGTTNPPTFFDGGVIEITTDGGAHWVDISTIVEPGYGGTLTEGGFNPLEGQRAFVGRNAAWPERNLLTLDLGTSLAGQTVRIRFRIGTDAGVGDYGWELDNISVQGTTNIPFPLLIEDSGVCRP
jgi:hypothetical protein